MRPRLLIFVIALAVALGQDKPARLTFEVASIKLSTTGGPGGGMKIMPGGVDWRAENFPLRPMISRMYLTPTRQVTGGPSWVDSDLWDIRAKADRPHNRDEMSEMFRNLLTDEFKLKLRKEVKEGPVYFLRVEKTGHKMKVNTSPDDFEIPFQGGPGGITVAKRATVERICWELGLRLQGDERPVIDATGLAGYYDFTLSFLPTLPPGFNIDSLPEAMRDRPNLFDAVRQQLGLRLEPGKGPVTSYVIDQVEKPSAN